MLMWELRRLSGRIVTAGPVAVLVAAASCSDAETTALLDGASGNAVSVSAATGGGGAATNASSGGTATGGAGQGGGEVGPPINEGFIGGPCEGAGDCAYEGGFCLPEDEGFPDGMCSLDCELYCPDQDGAVSTFCVDPADLGTEASDGLCTTHCDYGASDTGCRDGYQCKPVPRHGDPETVVYACVPGEDDPFPLSPCHQALLELGIAWAPAVNPLESPEGQPGLLCDVEDPVWIEPVLHGVAYRPSSLSEAPSSLFVACPMALAIERASAVLADRGATDLVHFGTYNCRVIAGTNELSEHGLARALDVGGVQVDGDYHSVLADWEKDQPNPTTEAGAFLRNLAVAWYTEEVFNIILTPDYNAAHADHLHCDLTPGSHFLQ
jgi:hypothetical protein